jgi:hypothetical protein
LFLAFTFVFHFFRQKPKQETLLKQNVLKCLKKLINKMDSNNSLQFSLSILSFLQISNGNDPLFDDSVLLFKALIHKINFANEKNVFISTKVEFLNFLKNWITNYIMIVLLKIFFLNFYFFLPFIFLGSKRRNRRKNN